MVEQSQGIVRSDAATAWLLGVGLVAAIALRGVVGGPDPSSSVLATLAFAGAVFALSVAGGWRPGRPRVSATAIGVAGGAVLVAASLTARPALVLGAPAGTSELLAFTPLVVIAVAAEEALVRGALFAAVMARWGATPALCVTSAAFALIHLPLYGAGALPLDFAVGLWLGGLRLLTGGIAAPTAAHLIADLAAGWFG